MSYPVISFGLVLKGLIKDCWEVFVPKANRFELSAILADDVVGILPQQGLFNSIVSFGIPTLSAR